MKDFKTQRPVHKFLAERGYKEYPHMDSEHVRTFQRAYALHKGKRFVEVTEYSYYDSYDLSYTVSSRFELPDGHSCKVDFYTLKLNELIERLEHFEDQAREVFNLLKGVGQE